MKQKGACCDEITQAKQGISVDTARAGCWSLNARLGLFVSPTVHASADDVNSDEKVPATGPAQFCSFRNLRCVPQRINLTILQVNISFQFVARLPHAERHARFPLGKKRPKHKLKLQVHRVMSVE